MTEPGALIGSRYRLIRQLGAGGMGVVWEARDERLDRPVAIKQLRTHAGLTEAETDLAAQRAMREARINARLQHPYAVSIFDVVEHAGQPCLVMELVPSVPLSDVMRELGALTPTEVARLGSQVAAALAAAHALGIVHRDVKPGNVLIGDDGAARICDFGISRALGDTTLTVTGMITGTPAYLAPEAARGEESTSASDVYSLGATLYAAVEGQPASGTEGNAIAVLYRVVAGEMRPPQRAGPLGPLLTAMMSVRPGDRPSMTEVEKQLSALAAGGIGAPQPPLSDRTQPSSVATVRFLSTSTPVAATSSPGPSSVSAPAPAPERTHATLPPTPPQAAPRRTARRRPLLVITVVVLAVLVVAVAVALLVQRQQPFAGAGPSPGLTSGAPESAATASATDSTPTPSGESSTGQPTTVELAQAVTDYYALLPDDTDAGWDRLTASYQRQTGGRESYDAFWNGISTVTVSAVRATAPDRVQATLRYVEKSGNRVSTERRTFRVVPSSGVLKIDQSSVV
ncbi:MAG TPA: serine/threonine-protein kinase [Microlunatus sp.]|nr:serine/threonine-protein kinase [Microlunatus sp.]